MRNDDPELVAVNARVSRQVMNLTFDDGPDHVWTRSVLAALEACGVIATFFVIGSRVAAQREVIDQVIALGHDVQLHCHEHIRHTDLTEAELDRETDRALATLAASGVTPSLWRPPWGVVSAATRKVAERYGLDVRLWDVDTHDWRGDSVQQMLRETESQLTGGGAVLMHDAIGPGATRQGCQNTVALIPELVRVARSLHFALEPMGVGCLSGAIR